MELVFVAWRELKDIPDDIRFNFNPIIHSELQKLAELKPKIKVTDNGVFIKTQFGTRGFNYSEYPTRKDIPKEKTVFIL